MNRALSNWPVKIVNNTRKNYNDIDDKNLSMLNIFFKRSGREMIIVDRDGLIWIYRMIYNGKQPHQEDNMWGKVCGVVSSIAYFS